jgi:histidinol-phosphate/aromatic aminotransferase/cobyric acid decarboxylase-like protein
MKGSAPPVDFFRTYMLKSKPHERLFSLFEERIYTESFKDLSGWDRTAIGGPHSEFIAHLLPSELSRYFFDRELPNKYFEDVKGQMAQLVSLRERTNVRADSLLLTPGATAALSVVLHFLHTCGVDCVLTDPPFYFSIKKLCSALGVNFAVASRSADELDKHDCIFELIEQHRHKRKAIVLAHPRYIVSRNYPAQVLSDIRSALNADDFMVIDQSTDMEFSNNDNFLQLDSPFIKIRTFGKALGMNGSRLAAIVADEELIAALNKQAGILYGSLDVAMLKLGALIAQTPEFFASHLQAVRRLVEEAYLEARASLEGSAFKIVAPENGFLGYILVDTSKVGRFTLYQGLLRECVHAMFSEDMGLKRLYHREMIRVNYLLDIREGLMVLRRLV